MPQPLAYAHAGDVATMSEGHGAQPASIYNARLYFDYVQVEITPEICC
jgi:hypothetical protein